MFENWLIINLITSSLVSNIFINITSIVKRKIPFNVIRNRCFRWEFRSTLLKQQANSIFSTRCSKDHLKRVLLNIFRNGSLHIVHCWQTRPPSSKSRLIDPSEYRLRANLYHMNLGCWWCWRVNLLMLVHLFSFWVR